MRAVLFTHHDGFVRLLRPMRECVDAMMRGGFWGNPPRGFLEEQTHRRTQAGHKEHAAAAFVSALQFGGLSENRAIEVIAEDNAGHLGSAFEPVTNDDLPRDRWFFAAWRRGHNGGPIWIDMPKARIIQKRRLMGHAARLFNAGTKTGDLALWDRADHVKKMLPRLFSRIDAETDPTSLRSIWPESST